MKYRVSVSAGFEKAEFPLALKTHSHSALVEPEGVEPSSKKGID